MIILSKKSKEQKNAGPKAPSDIVNILSSSRSITFKDDLFLKPTILFYYLILHFFKDFVLVQHPILFNNRLYSLLNAKKTIILIHDINGLRNNNGELLKEELGLFKRSNSVIVHNDKMRNFLIQNGIDEDKIFVLGLFDYLCKNKNGATRTKDMRIVYAGNLKKDKTPFLYQIDDRKLKYAFHLYGLGINKSISEKILYKGSFDPNDLSSLKGTVGLVWDGNYDESDQNDSFKNYTKYNNPHKLSCYIAAGLPVIVWRKAAIANFVLENNIGYTISNIYDINKIDFSDYSEKKKNVDLISKKIREGFYTKKVINEIINKKEP